MPSYIDLPSKRIPMILADWLEINALIDFDGSMSPQDLRYPLSNYSGEEEGSAIALEAENLVAGTFREIERRIDATQSGYPFIIKKGRLVLKGKYSKFLPYIFCLLISYFGVEKNDDIRDWNTRLISKKFEILSANAIENLLKNDKGNLFIRIFGFPRSYTRELPASFSKALKQICLECGEMEPRNNQLEKDMKDAGLDILAWKKFPDNLCGSVFFLGQCASGDNWIEKQYEINNFLSFVNNTKQYIKGIFIPHIIDTHAEWDTYTGRTGMLFDRCRLAYLSDLGHREESKFFKEFVSNSLKQILKKSKKRLTS